VRGLRPGIPASASIGRRPSSQTSQALVANERTHQLPVSQLQDSQDSSATYNLYTSTSTEKHHCSFIHNLNHPPLRKASRTRAAKQFRRLQHSQSPPPTPHALSTTGAAPDSSLVCSIVVVFLIPVPLLFQRAWPDPRCYSTVSPRKRNCLWIVFSARMLKCWAIRALIVA
jgi:hypothetical protein